MIVGPVLLDSAVFIYAVGGEHPYRQPCRALLAGLGEAGIAAEASVLAAQEVMHQRLRRTGDREQAAAAAREMSLFATLHDLTRGDLDLARRLFVDHADLDAADACHAATSINRDIATIVSPDAAFDAVAGLTRVDPVDAAAQL